MAKTYWLLKSEPETYSLDDLKKAKGQTDYWDGIRNYQARNFIRDQIKKGDEAFFYHSNCKVPGIVGIVTIVKDAYPDFTAWDPNSKYYDPKSTPDDPRWFMMDVQFKHAFREIISLTALKQIPELEGMPLLKRGNRLSVFPVESKHWNTICAMGA